MQQAEWHVAARMASPAAPSVCCGSVHGGGTRALKALSGLCASLAVPLSLSLALSLCLRCAPRGVIYEFNVLMHGSTALSETPESSELRARDISDTLISLNDE